MNQKLLADTYSIIDSCFDFFLNSTVTCFNGGKDATVLLDLVYKFYTRRFPEQLLSCLFIEEPDSFSELNQFVQETVSRYKYLKFTRISGSLKQGIQSFHDFDKSVSGFFLATRRTDIPCITSFLMSSLDETKFIHYCDRDWPPIYRLQPLLDWSYHDIWDYIRETNLPYCSLYNQGYSSLGSIMNSSRNPLLTTESGGFLPPWTLDDIGTERKSRK